jgi:histidinol-phosphate aminotransferase|tara:strand:+ start:8956 stop:10035 length:1080 start_codon:yes stop_codon:yes gene_type:complete
MSQFERPNIAAMQGYSSGEQPLEKETLKLNTNENPFPASAKVQAALMDFATADLRVYPQPTADKLRDAIAAHHGLTRDHIMLTHAGDEALRLAITTFVEPGGTLGTTDPSYSLYPVLSKIQDATMRTLALQDNWSIPDGFAQVMTQHNAQLTCLVNPHAPSGHLTPLATIEAIAQNISGVLLVDEAYIDFVDPSIAYSTKDLINAQDNVLVLRTFSKGYSLAGLRLGYLLGDPELIKPMLEKTRDSYNIDAISQALGLAAIEDQAYAQETWRQVREQRQVLNDALSAIGLSCPASEANFLLATMPEEIDAEGLYEALKAKGILVRYFPTPRLKDKLRITVGTAEQNEKLINTIRQLITR